MARVTARPVRGLPFAGLATRMFSRSDSADSGARRFDARPRPWRRQLAAAVACAALAFAAFAHVPWLTLLDERVRDSLTGLIVRQGQVPTIAVIDIDEESLQRIGSWPWPRETLAELVEELLGPLGARAVALDIVLPEAANGTGDARLAAIAQHWPLTLSQVLDFVPRPAPVATGTLAAGRPAAAGTPQATGFVANHQGLSQARCVGHIGMQPDGDGVLRRVHLEAQVAGRSFSTLSLALLQCAEPARALAARENLSLAESVWRVPFRYDPDSYTALAAQRVLSGQLDPALIRGKYVLVGSSAVGLSDYVATPLHPVTAGVLVHAQVLTELLDSTAPLPQRVTVNSWLPIAALLVGLACLLLASRKSPAAGAAAIVTVMAAWFAIATWSFARGLGPSVLPVAAAFVAFSTTWFAIDLRDARRMSRHALNTLSNYVAEPVLKLLLKQGLTHSLTPNQKHITVLVADMVGYTRLTAESSLEASARITTQFLEAITGPVLQSGGTLDRYTGDGLIAFWGAPIASSDHAQAAYDAAQAMLVAVRELNERRLSRDEPSLAMRIGIESGLALVGDLGSSARSVYTAVGTCINLASRLQEVARDIGETLVIGPEAQRQIRSTLRTLEPRAIRGLEAPLQLYSAPL